MALQISAPPRAAERTRCGRLGHDALEREYPRHGAIGHTLSRRQLLGGGDGSVSPRLEPPDDLPQFSSAGGAPVHRHADCRAGSHGSVRLWRRAREPRRAGQGPAASDDASLHAAAQCPLRARQRRRRDPLPRLRAAQSRRRGRSRHRVVGVEKPWQPGRRDADVDRGARRHHHHRIRQAKPRKEPRSRSPIFSSSPWPTIRAPRSRFSMA